MNFTRAVQTWNRAVASKDPVLADLLRELGCFVTTQAFAHTRLHPMIVNGGVGSIAIEASANDEGARANRTD